MLGVFFEPISAKKNGCLLFRFAMIDLDCIYEISWYLKLLATTVKSHSVYLEHHISRRISAHSPNRKQEKKWCTGNFVKKWFSK